MFDLNDPLTANELNRIVRQAVQAELDERLPTFEYGIVSAVAGGKATVLLAKAAAIGTPNIPYDAAATPGVGDRVRVVTLPSKDRYIDANLTRTVPVWSAAPVVAESAATDYANTAAHGWTEPGFTSNWRLNNVTIPPSGRILLIGTLLVENPDAVVAADVTCQVGRVGVEAGELGTVGGMAYQPADVRRLIPLQKVLTRTPGAVESYALVWASTSGAAGQRILGATRGGSKNSSKWMAIQLP